MNTFGHFPGEETGAYDNRHYLANTFLFGLKNRSRVWLQSVLAEEVTWTFPGATLISGKSVGTEAVLQKAQLLATFGVTIHSRHILFGITEVAFFLHMSGIKGRPLPDEFMLLFFTIEKGKIAGITSLLSCVEAANDFFTPVL